MNEEALNLLKINGEFVILRCRDAGVHFGTLVAWQGQTAMLKDCRNIWEWEGANTLKEVALHGITSGKVSQSVERSIFTDVIQIEFPTDKARKNLEKQKWTT